MSILPQLKAGISACNNPYPFRDIIPSYVEEKLEELTAVEQCELLNLYYACEIDVSDPSRWVIDFIECVVEQFESVEERFE